MNNRDARLLAAYRDVYSAQVGYEIATARMLEAAAVLTAAKLELLRAQHE
jgi:hypothetical protein